MDCIWIHFTTTFRGGQPPRFCIATLLQVKLIKGLQMYTEAFAYNMMVNYPLSEAVKNLVSLESESF